MDYYEELGLTSSASTDEIRRAYKNVARLLHPDRCQDEEARRLAELQLTRLNGVMAVLTNPEKRRAYDRRVEAQRAGEEAAWRLAAAPAGLKRRRLSWVWVVAAGIGLGAVVLFFRQDGWEAARVPGPASAVPVRKEAGRAQTSAVAPAAGVRTWSYARRRPAVETEATGAAARAQTTAGAEKPVTAVRANEAGDQQPAPRERPPVPAVAGEDRATSVYAGAWFYARPKTAPDAKGFYPPVYIEMTVSQEGALLKGRYRGRYDVADRPISPEVQFRFEGPVGRGTIELPWAGGSGAKGTVRLKPLGEGSIEVTWWATELVPEMALASGTAELIRMKEPQ